MQVAAAPSSTHVYKYHTCHSSESTTEKRGMEERKYTELFNYLWKNEHPDGADKCNKRSNRQMSASYEVKDGLLVLKGTRQYGLPTRKRRV